MKRHLTQLLAGAAVAAALGTTAWAAEIRVGLLLPYSGVYAALGDEIDQGFQLALEQHGGDNSFDIVREDTEVKPPVGLAKAKKLVLQDEVDVIAGVVSSAVLGAIRDFVHGAEVPLIVANAGNDVMTGEKCSPWITRVSFSNGQINRPMGPWMVDQGITRVYTLAPDYAAGRQMIEAFTAEFTKAGGQIVGGEYTPFGKTKDFGPYLTAAKASGAEAVFVFYAGGEAISFVKQYDSFGLKETMGLYGSGFLTSPLYVNAEGPAAIGIKTALHYVPTLDTPENRAFREAFEAKTGRVPSEYAVQGYDAGRLVAEAVKGGATDRAALGAALPTIQFTGPRGPFRIDERTNNIIQNIYIYETVADGDALTQSVVGKIEGVRDPQNGCQL